MSPGVGSGSQATNIDQPTVDEPISFPAGPSSPPARRRKRQEDLVSSILSEDTMLGQQIRPGRNAARVDSQTRDLLDDQTGTFPADIGHDDEDDLDFQEAPEEPPEPFNYRAAQEEMYSGPMDFESTSRSYDDEDAALQVALKASMDDLPPGWVPPEAKAVEKPVKKAAPVPEPIKKDPPPAGPAKSILSPGAGGSKFKEEIEEDTDDHPETLTAGTPGRAASLEELTRNR